MKRKTIDLITLGCSKNLVDSEKLMRQLEENGYHVTHDSASPEGDIVIINTCGFIGDAKEESINTILEFCQAKDEGLVDEKSYNSFNQINSKKINLFKIKVSVSVLFWVLLFRLVE